MSNKKKQLEKTYGSSTKFSVQSKTKTMMWVVYIKYGEYIDNIIEYSVHLRDGKLASPH